MEKNRACWTALPGGLDLYRLKKAAPEGSRRAYPKGFVIYVGEVEGIRQERIKKIYFFYRFYAKQ
jgi:hypothetical protein